jgi:hypothetical protein
LTLLVGTNGLGKSGFFDALEWGLTGQVRRFKAYLPSADEAKYLTRRTAPAGSHEVSLGFTGEKQLRRTGRAGPSPDAVVAMLKVRVLWENWNREMLPVPEHLTPPMSNLAEMLW